ncbi:hypothetical protein VOLCADRAFT_87953 [Volvox carteri f. nagariensis]|uniref:Uncharacterized protein n=1 Tax=Volvox carteri f. nagariensis TaxID=3068 RepID=D8TMP1_VOLCA|nr:uncharacterized protein VOLCADRAFT_87953 [Volvox carteri f. nagariensis]EFJ51161.1 hypothetical protein VOLCADRAFT_87953 [Volvox carteri f. nagariensis]|eukprot:XP_002947628.1 hypothetical protein VOLCADRAFT_87953 [Volvox carteri f. nagariensis]
MPCTKVNDAFRNASENLSSRIFRTTSPAFPGVVAGLGLPLDAEVLRSPRAGTGLPPVAEATQTDFDTFSRQLMGALATLGQITGSGYTGLTANGNAYLNSFCCNTVRKAGIDLSLSPADDSTIKVGGVSIDMASLLAAIPAAFPAGSSAATAAKTAVNAAGQALSALGESITGLPRCSLLDWLAFALQGDPQLAQQFSQLIRASLGLNAGLFTQALAGANQAANNAAGILSTLG